MADEPITEKERQRILSQTVATEVATKKARVESQSPEQAVLVYGKPVNHLLHFLLGFPTVTVWWWTVWPALAILGGEKRKVVRVDDYGNALVS